MPLEIELKFNEKYPGNCSGYFGCGSRIRTQTNRVRVEVNTDHPMPMAPICNHA